MNQYLRLYQETICAAVVTICLFSTSCNSSNHDNSVSKENMQDTAGFVQIFDGASLNGWEGDTAVWYVSGGAITGEVTQSSQPLKANTFLIWSGASPANFELTGEYEISAEGNSGVQYRSERVGAVPFGLRGYQFDIDGGNTYTGQNYEERARAIIAFRGQKVTLPPVNESIEKLVGNNTWPPSIVTDSLGSADSLRAIIHTGWNSFRIVANGNHLQHYINGVLMCDVTDNDTTNRKASGIIGLQMHAGHIMKVSFRNMMIKESK